ncbi:MAG: M15 family metallopeptidase [Pseudomonadota bacterium]
MENIIELSDSYKEKLIKCKIWQEDCPVHLDRLRIVQIEYIDFAGVTHDDGQMIVLDVVADNVARIFQELYKLRFPLHSILPMENFAGDDEKSMAANNSSAFNHRKIAGTDTVSIHSYGLAIDINPVQNPFIIMENEHDNALTIFPAGGKKYLNRTNKRPGMIENMPAVLDIFARNGFTIWGGNWNSMLDYHHFQIERSIAEKLSQMNFTDGKEFFNSLLG